MKKISKKKVLVLIIFIVMIIVEIKVFTDSLANKFIEITTNIVDTSSLLDDEKYIMQATNENESGYCITLPSVINEKNVASYFVSEKLIGEKNVDIENVEENIDEKNEIIEELEQTEDENSQQNSDNLVEKHPGEIIYLTQEELDKKSITLEVEYDLQEKDGQVLYNKLIEQEIENNKVEIKGYMPIDGKAKIEVVNKEEVNNLALQYGNKNASLKMVYDIKIISNEKEYEPIEFDKNMEVTITGLDNVDTQKQKYKILHIKDDNIVEEIKEVETKENSVIFKTNHFSNYAVVLEDAATTAEYAVTALADESAMTYAVGETISNDADIWDGSIADGFVWGEGTQDRPYLISSGAELAYLAQEVNNGNSFEGKIFQLARDINLNNRNWTPIGNISNSFKGVFNGSGRTISNATIAISGTLTTNQIYSYGFFGSIGDGNSYAIIKNVQFDNIDVEFNISGTTSTNTNTRKGYNIGIVTGTMYNNSKVSNVSVKKSIIEATGSIYVRSRIFQIFVGGIAGNVQNANGTYTDPGAGSRYSIENCYVSANIDMSRIVSYRSSRQYYMTLVQTGGIVGSIYRQPVWPDNCLYSGSIDANGFIGPIFGGLIQTDSNNNNVNNFSAYWNGNQAGGNLRMTSHYTNFTVNGTSFTDTETNGTSYSYISSTISNNNISGVKGVNKGIYTNNISSLEDDFNNGTTDVTWLYEDGDLRLIPRLSVSATQTATDHYEATITDRYNIGNYTYEWYNNDNLDTNYTGNFYDCSPNFTEDQHIVLVVNDGDYFSALQFTVKRYYIAIEFDVNTANASVQARLVGTALPFVDLNDYTYQWYKEDIAGEGGPIEGATSLNLSGLEEYMDYRLVATNSTMPQLSAENSFTFGDRIVVYVDYNYGDNSRDGFTEQTAVQNLSTAYSKLDRNGSRNKNVIVMMGTYNDSNVAFLNSQTATTYAKNATITGKYKGKDYSAVLRFGSGSSFYRHLTADLTFQYMTLNGGGTGNSMYLLCQGYDFTVGEGVTMTNYQTANPNQGLLGNRAPAFHLFAGWYQYDETSLPNNDCEILLKSGTYGRVVLGGTPGTASGLYQYNSYNFMGSSKEDTFRVSVTVDIKNSTTSSDYDYDVNLLVGGSASGNNYSQVTENIKSGTVGRLLGGSIGDSSTTLTTGGGWWGGGDPWEYPIDSFFGGATINVTGGSITELYGGCLGRNMDVVGSSTATGNTCDSYFYGIININIEGGQIINNIYGAGAGGVTGYDANSSDPFKSYGEEFDTSVNINISAGTIGGNVYGGGYGYTEYLNANVTAEDGGALYGDSNIIISGSPTINGNIFGAGCGYNYSSRTQIASMKGNSNIEITGTPTITGKIFGSGAGISGYSDMAKLTGTATVKIKADLATEVYGGGNIAKLVGTPTINIESGNHTGDIYGGGNLGAVEGTSNVDINGGTQTRVFGGGNQASVTNSIVNVNAGTTTEIYAGGNAASVDTTKVYLKGGEATTIYGGSNQTGTVQTSNIETTSGKAETIYGGNNVGGTTNDANVTINGGNITTAVYGGGNQVDTTKTTVNLKKADNTIPYVFGGGNQAGVTDTYVYCNGASVTNVFGGSNTNGTVNTSNVYVNNGILENVYGGNNQGGTTVTTNVTINGGSTVNVYGGGDQASSAISNITTTSGTVNNIYGGGNQAGVTTTNVTTNGGSIGNVFGGSNRSGDVTESYVETNDATATSQTGGVTMQITATAEEATWQSTTYPTVAKMQVVFTNNSASEITNWNANIYVPDSTLFTNYSNSDIQESNGNYTLTEKNRYYGNNTISAGGSYSLEFEVLTMQEAENFVYGYGISGEDANGNAVSDSNSIIQSVYGGNNQGGKTATTHVTINGGGVVIVYGGGNQAITDETNVQVNGEVKKNVFGGGNQAGVNTNTNVSLTGATVGDNVYGGGDEGTVTGNTYVHVKNSNLKNSLYAGGNGSTAIVYGNTNLIMDGTTNQVINSVFGGGNKAETGQESANNSKSTVNIVGGTIGKNVYGGANTSVVYGTTETNIGYDTVGDTSLEIGDIEIKGTVFGGGEANESGSEVYDFSFISVTRGIDIQIDGNGHGKFAIKGSIFGSGNASSTSGESYITIKNYGTADNPQSNVSLQRANCATIINSAISLSGATDRTNEYSSTFFAISRVDQVKLKNNSILYLCNGANLLKELDSLVDENGTEVKGTVTINKDTGATTRNVDNRIYMLEGKNLNIATNEQVTAYGKVQGMFFFGLFTNRNSPSTSTGLYHQSYNNGDSITNAGTFISNSYVMAQHMNDHNIEIDGFYTNYNEEGHIKANYIDTTPKDDVYYIWLVGEKLDVTIFEMSLVASKYATLGTYELLLQGFSDQNLKFSIVGFSAGLANGISLVDPNEIQAIEPDESRANSVYGLSMRTGNIGWETKGTTTFLTNNGGTYTGKNDYDKDNSTYTPTLNFCFYHSQNLTTKQALGDLTIRLQVLKPIDDLNYELSYIDINITLSSNLFQNDFYEAAITPGQEFGLFTSTDTTITSKSSFSTYYSLYVGDFSESDYYDDYRTYQRVLVSRNSNDAPYYFPENTKLTMLDMVTNKYYYYIVTSQDVANNKYEYKLSDFVAMGSSDSNSKFDEQSACDQYYDTSQDLIYENYIFHINFADTNMTNDIQNNSLLMELRDTDNQTLVGVLGIQRDVIVYNVFCNKDATIRVEGKLEPQTLYLGNKLNLNVTTNFTQEKLDSKTVYDTQYFDKKLGIKISIYDNNGNRLNSESLLGVNFELDGELYYPRFDGTTRINIADKVTDVLAKIKMNTKDNTTLATGDYKIRIESFGSSDGIYYGLTASDMIELDLRIINSSYGLKVTTGDTFKIIDKDTGFTENDNNTLTSLIEYSSGLSDPNIAISLYRRDYSETFSQDYNLVDLADYVKDYLSPTARNNEYVVTNSPTSSINHTLLLKSNLTTGTYKLVYKLYDGENYVGEAYEYMVIK